MMSTLAYWANSYVTKKMKCFEFNCRILLKPEERHCLDLVLLTSIQCCDSQHNDTCHKTLSIMALRITNIMQNVIYAYASVTMRLCQPPDGSTSPKYKLLHF
jgi:hypothetical protein